INLWSWPFLGGGGTDLSYLPGASVLDNLGRFVGYVLFTSAGWDLGRAVTNAVAIAVLGPAILATLRRAARRARFSPADAGPLRHTDRSPAIARTTSPDLPA